MLEHVVFRCQLLSVFAECRPCCPDTILDFRRFLVVERDFLTKNCALSFVVGVSMFMSSVSGSFFCVRVDDARVAENFRLFWMNPETHLFSTFLEFTQHFPYLFFGGSTQ